MTINEKYSYNGFKWKHPILQEMKEDNNIKKAQLFSLRRLGKITKRQYLYELKELKRDYSFNIAEVKCSFKNKSFKDVPASEFNNTEIVRSGFAQEEPFTDVFNKDMTGVIFRKGCNLGNCNVPAGNTVECFNKHYEIQNDGEYWVVGKNRKPIEPIKLKGFIQFSLSIDPKDIPDKPLSQSILLTARQNTNKGEL